MLSGNVNNMGRFLKDGLCDLQVEHPIIGTVCRRGLMVATEFTGSSGKPDTKTTVAVHKASLARNLLMLSCGSSKNIIRWIPPPIVTTKQINAVLSIFNEALGEVR